MTPDTETTNLADAVTLLTKVREQIESVIIGKTEAVEQALTAFLAKGHVLLEDLPGTGKTTLAKTIACTLGCEFKRIQFTPDLMPSDITGMNYFNTRTGDFEFRAGPIFTNILLTDEINRTTPRTQSALLEAMEEKQVTVDGMTHSLPQPFLVLATQNPIESEGTFPLPNAQQDRFLLRISLGYPTRSDEEVIIQKHAFTSTLDEIKPVLAPGQAASIQEMTKKIYLDQTLVQYILDYIEASREDETVELALSPRASLAMVRAVRAYALLKGRDYVLPDDVKALCVPVFAHRLKLKKTEIYKGRKSENLIKQFMERIPLKLKG